MPTYKDRFFYKNIDNTKDLATKINGNVTGVYDSKKSLKQQWGYDLNYMYNYILT